MKNAKKTLPPTSVVFVYRFSHDSPPGTGGSPVFFRGEIGGWSKGIIFRVRHAVLGLTYIEVISGWPRREIF